MGGRGACHWGVLSGVCPTGLDPPASVSGSKAAGPAPTLHVAAAARESGEWVVVETGFIAVDRFVVMGEVQHRSTLAWEVEQTQPVHLPGLLVHPNCSMFDIRPDVQRSTSTEGVRSETMRDACMTAAGCVHRHLPLALP